MDNRCLCSSKALRLRGAEPQLPGTTLPRGGNALRLIASERRACAFCHRPLLILPVDRKQDEEFVLVFRNNVTQISTEEEAAFWELINRGARFSSRIDQVQASATHTGRRAEGIGGQLAVNRNGRAMKACFRDVIIPDAIKFSRAAAAIGAKQDAPFCLIVCIPAI